MQWKTRRSPGRVGGRSKALDKAQRLQAVALYKEKSHSIDQICRMMNVSRPTLYKYIQAEKASLQSQAS